MIISHTHKFIFFAVPKTATHAIREALRQHLGPEDWEQQVLYGKQTLPIPQIAEIPHGHISTREIEPHLSEEIWQSYFKFGFVRNPFDRFVSTCFFLNRRDPNFEKSAREFMKRRLNFEPFRQRILVRPQSDLLTDESGELAVDFVGRYENLQQSYDEVCAQIELPKTELKRSNTSEHAAYESYYDQALTDVVAEFYEDDLKNFYDSSSARPA